MPSPHPPPPNPSQHLPKATAILKSSVCLHDTDEPAAAPVWMSVNRGQRGPEHPRGPQPKPRPPRRGHDLADGMRSGHRARQALSPVPGAAPLSGPPEFLPHTRVWLRVRTQRLFIQTGSRIRGNDSLETNSLTFWVGNCGPCKYLS